MSQRIAKRVLLLDRRLVRQPSTGKDKRYWRALPAERALGVSGSRVPTGVGNRWGQRGRPQRQYLLGKPAIGGQKMPRHGQKPDAPGQMTFFGRRQGEVPGIGKPQNPEGCANVYVHQPSDRLARQPLFFCRLFLGVAHDTPMRLMPLTPSMRGAAPVWMGGFPWSS